jgi:GT2 family glycosyltransferase
MHITVCICTRDRGASVAVTLGSLAASLYDDFDVVVVDQSTSEDTADAVASATIGDPRFSYLHTTSVGLCAARNIAIEHATGPLLAFTDDDCEVSVDWLRLLAQHFSEQPRVGQICGAVFAGSHDPTQGYVPNFSIQEPFLVSSPWMKWRCKGMGANMAFRLDALRKVGPFDEMLGPGAAMYMADDYDITYRMLRAGYPVLCVPDAFVIHHGFREWADASILKRRSGFATAAAHMKQVRSGDIAIVPTLIYDWLHVVSWPRLLFMQRHSGVGYAWWYVKGAIASWRYPVNRRNRLYARRKDHALYTT